MPSLMASGEPASTAYSSGVEAPSRVMNAKANGRSSGCCSVGWGTQVHDWTVPAGPTSTKSWASSAPVAGSHSIGGTSTPSPQRIPRIRFSVSAVMNAPVTGPSDRVYGNVMVLSTNLTTCGIPPESPVASPRSRVAGGRTVARSPGLRGPPCEASFRHLTLWGRVGWGGGVNRSPALGSASRRSRPPRHGPGRCRSAGGRSGRCRSPADDADESRGARRTESVAGCLRSAVEWQPPRQGHAESDGVRLGRVVPDLGIPPGLHFT